MRNLGILEEHHLLQDGMLLALLTNSETKYQHGKQGQLFFLPIVGGYSEYIFLSSNELVPVPPGLDHAEAVSIVLNYITAYQMLHRCVHIKPGEIILINGGAAGGVGTALLQLGKLANLKKMYGTASYRKHDIVSSLGGIPIDYKSVDLVQEIIKLTSDDDKSESGVDAVFDGIGGKSFKSSYEILRSAVDWSLMEAHRLQTSEIG